MNQHYKNRPRTAAELRLGKPLREVSYLKRSVFGFGNQWVHTAAPKHWRIVARPQVPFRPKALWIKPTTRPTLITGYQKGNLLELPMSVEGIPSEFFEVPLDVTSSYPPKVDVFDRNVQPINDELWGQYFSRLTKLDFNTQEPSEIVTLEVSAHTPPQWAVMFGHALFKEYQPADD